MLLDFFPPNARLRRTWLAWCQVELDLADRAYHVAWEEGPGSPHPLVIHRLENACRRLNLATGQGRPWRPTRPRGA